MSQNVNRLSVSSITLFAVVALIAFYPSAANAQPLEQLGPGPEHKQLATRVGKWAYEGEGTECPFFPPGKFVGVQTTRLILNGFFLEDRFEDKNSTGYAAQGVTITGYDAEKKSLIEHSFENDGHVGTSVVTTEGSNIWKVAGTRTDRKGITYKTRYTLTISKDGKQSKGLSEYSADDGKTWAVSFHVSHTKVED